MNQLVVPQGFGPVSNIFANQPVEDDLSAGVHGGFGLVGYKGKVWSLRYRGEERQLMRPNNEGPYNSIDVVILKASTQISKIFYEAGYVEGSTAAPDCFSTNGLTPDVSATKKQAQVCASCPRNAWGSRITPAGKQGKACSDSKRLAVVPLVDIKNEAFGGPLLLRVPAASLQDLAQFGQVMSGYGYRYYAIGTRIYFDPAESYPKFKFEALRPLSDDEAKMVVELRANPQVARILSESEFTGAPETAQQIAPPSPFTQAVAQPLTAPVTPVVSQPVASPTKPMAASHSGAPAPAGPATQVAPTPAVAPVQVSPQPAPVAPVQAAPVTPDTVSPFEDAFDAKLDALLPH